MIIEELSYDEYFDFFANDLYELRIDSENLGEMLDNRISAILKNIKEMELTEKMCDMANADIHGAISAYSRALEAYCLKLKITYAQSFERLKCRIEQERINQERKKCEIHSLNEKG